MCQHDCKFAQFFFLALSANLHHAKAIYCVWIIYYYNSSRWMTYIKCAHEENISPAFIGLAFMTFTLLLMATCTRTREGGLLVASSRISCVICSE